MILPINIDDTTDLDNDIDECTNTTGKSRWYYWSNLAIPDPKNNF